MRLMLPAIFCSALLSGLLNMKRFALQGDGERRSARASSATLPFCFVTQLSWRALLHSGTRVLCTRLKYGQWDYPHLLLEGAI